MNTYWKTARYPTLQYLRMKTTQNSGLVVVAITCVLLWDVLLITNLTHAPFAVTMIGGGLTLIAIVIGSSVARRIHRHAQVVASLNHHAGGHNTLLAGYSMIPVLGQLDAIAKERDVRTISSYGFGDDRCGELMVWNDPQDGLATVAAIKDHIKSKDDSSPLTHQLDDDLQRWEVALERAVVNEVKFCVLLGHDKHTNGNSGTYEKGDAF